MLEDFYNGRHSCVQILFALRGTLLDKSSTVLNGPGFGRHVGDTI
jgi:hypothetical protein